MDAYKNNAITPELAEEIKQNHPIFLENTTDLKETSTSPHTENTRNLDVKNVELDRKSTRLNSSHSAKSRMPSSA